MEVTLEMIKISTILIGIQITLALILLVDEGLKKICEVISNKKNKERRSRKWK
jgi:hypothetical protein